MATPYRGVSIADGLSAVAEGFGFVLTRPSLWPWALVPVGMMLVLTVALGVLGVWAAGTLSDRIIDPASAGFWAGIGYWLLRVLLWAVALFIALILGLSLAQPLSGFALERIAHAQELALTGRPPPAPSFLVSLFISFKAVAAGLLVGVPLLVVLFLVSFLFPPAAVVTVPLKFLVCSWLLAWDFLDYPLGLHGYGLRARLRWVGRNFGAFTAFGAAWFALLVLPGIVLVLLPMGVAGATRLVVADARS
jgi:CysZ protein